MAYKTQLQFTHVAPFRIGGQKRRSKVQGDLVNFLAGVAQGRYKTSAVTLVQDLNNAVAASGTVTLSTSSGTVGSTINGVSVTVAFSTSDTVTAGLLRDAINASVNALVAGHVTASANLGVVTITAANAGITGNAITLAATGTGATASGARLNGGTAATGSSTVTFSL
jgi:phage tail sheath gpL-like